jgi:hypothetical protein
MDAVEPEEDRAEQWLRLVLLLAFWSLWLAVRGSWWVLAALASRRSRKLLRRAAAVALLAALVLFAPHAVGFWWARMMLLDAAEIAALQSEGRDPQDIEADIRRRAFRLGFRDIVQQPEAIRIDWEERDAGRVCRVALDFWHQPTVYGWTVPPLRIQARVERFVLPGRDGNLNLRDQLD